LFLAALELVNNPHLKEEKQNYQGIKEAHARGDQRGMQRSNVKHHPFDR
jgi:hypothetical protein